MKLSLFISLAIIATSCGGFDSNDEKRVFSEILDAKIISEYPEKLGDNYLVYPYYVDFEFSDLLSKKKEDQSFRKKVAERVFSKLDIDANLFTEIQEGVNNKYKGLHSDNLYDLSIGNKSTLIFTFSGLNENLVFVNLYWYHDAISKEDLTKNFNFRNNLYSVKSFIAFLDSDKKVVKEVVFDNGRSIEWWPSEESQ